MHVLVNLMYSQDEPSFRILFSIVISEKDGKINMHVLASGKVFRYPFLNSEKAEQNNAFIP